MKKGLEIGQTHDVEPMKKMVGPLAPRSPRRGGAAVAVRNVVVIALLSLVLGALLGLYGEVLTAVAASLLRSVRAGSRSEYIDWIPVVGSLAKK